MDDTTTHPEDRCARCGGINIPSWSVDSDRWNQATAGTPDRDRILCPGCFVSYHEHATRMRTSWMLVPDPRTSFRHLDDDLNGPEQQHTCQAPSTTPSSCTALTSADRPSSKPR